MNFNRFELSGALADIGVLFPIIVALIAVNDVNPVVSLGLCGLFYIVTSLYYKVPVPVQPLKVFCTVAIAVKASPILIQSGAFLIGIVFLAVSPQGHAGNQASLSTTGYQVNTIRHGVITHR